MDRPRHRRRDPRRTGPIRNAGEPRQGATNDAASDGVREGYRVIEEQIRRGRRMAEERYGKPWSDDDRYDREPGRRPRPSQERYYTGYGEEEPGSRCGGGGLGLLAMPLRHLDRLVREILRQIGSARPDPWKLIELLFRLQIEAMAELARVGFGTLGMARPRYGDSYEEDVQRVEHDIDESLDEIDDLDEELDDDLDEEEIEDDFWEWPAAPNIPVVIRSTVPIPVYVWSYERTEIDLELPAGAHSLDLMVEPPLATGIDQPAPAFKAELVTLAGGPVILRIEVPRDLPAGRYLRRVLVRATREPVGELTVQVGTLPKARPKVSPKTDRKAKPQARKK